MDIIGLRVPRAFINIAYHEQYESRFLALIATVSLYGFVPTAALEGDGHPNRLQRIIDSIRRSAISLHDLSWVFLDGTEPPTPRFNMPFELGVAVLQHRRDGNGYCVLDTVPYRLDKALSDLKGEDPIIHNGTPRGIFLSLRGAFHRSEFQPADLDFAFVYVALEDEWVRLKRMGYQTVFSPSPFDEVRRVALREAAVRRS